MVTLKVERNQPFYRPSYKMVKHIQKIRRLLPDELFECDVIDHFVGLVLKRLICSSSSVVASKSLLETATYLKTDILF